mgnify:CR=1 FL=1
MENEKRAVIEELSSIYKRKEKLINILLEESIKLGYNINNSRQNIDEFYSKCYLSKTCPRQNKSIEIYRII